jgi:glycine/D-amino acid oxidase-like deaminating enzyme
MAGAEDVAAHQHIDVLIVGAGVAGLSAALTLAPEVGSVVILEGSDHVGGRLHSEAWGSEVRVCCLEHGAQWVHGSNGKNPIHHLTQELGLQGSVDGDRDGCRIICAASGLDLTAEAEPRSAALEEANAKLERCACDEWPPQPDYSVRAGLRACGWQPTTALDDALEWLSFDFEYAETSGLSDLKMSVRSVHSWG